MAWLFLLSASVFEIGFATSLKYTEGFTKIIPTAITIVLSTFSLGLLTQSLKSMPVGSAYAIWTGIGSAGTAIIGMYLFNEPRDAARIFCILLIIAGVVGLKLISEH